MSNLIPFAGNVWLLEGDEAHMYGVPFATRAVIIRLPDGKIWVHSPVALTPERIGAVAALGPVSHLIEPNKIHSLYLADWRAEWPEATSWVSPRFAERHPDIEADLVLEDEAPPAWLGTIEQQVIKGHKLLDEVWFCHKPSGSLIVTDLIQKHDPQKQGFPWGLLKRVAGLLGKEGGTAIDIRLTFEDKALARRCVEYVLDWEFDRLILSHGFCFETGGKDEVRKAMNWLLETAQ